MKTKPLVDQSYLLSQLQQTAHAAVIKRPREINPVELSPLRPGPGEVRVQLEGCGICASNLPVWEGREWFEYPREPGSPGHEGWGIVDAVGDGVREFKLRERVTGLSYHAFATHDIFRAEDLVSLPDFLADKPFPGEPLGCVMNIFDRSDIFEGMTVAVVGCGFLGLLLIQLLKSAGCTVIAISRRNFSLEKAVQLGADHAIPMQDHEDIIRQVKQFTGGAFCSRTIECTGKEWPLNLSIAITGTRGKLIVAGFHQDGMRSVNVQMLNWRGIDLISAHERDPAQYIKGIKKSIQAIERGKMYPFDLITHQYSLENLSEGFQDLQKRPEGFIKGIVII